jgi:hypothetical protein
MCVAVENVKIERFEGDSLVVCSEEVGTFLVPLEVIDDESEIWRVGDSGTLLVSSWWAKQKGIKGKRIKKKENTAGVPVELHLKATRSVSIAPPKEEKTSAMEDQQFRDLVSAEIRGEAADGVSSFLRKPENVRRWRESLVALKVDVEAQFALRKSRADEIHAKCLKRSDGRTEYFKSKTEYLEWKSGANAFKKNIEKRIRETNTMLQSVAKSETGYKDLMWRLINGAEYLIPRDNSQWHQDLAELRALSGHKET